MRFFQFQLNQLQTQLRQKDRMLDQITDAEKQKNAEISSLKDNLATANDELTQKSVQVSYITCCFALLKGRFTHIVNVEV